MLKLLWPDNRRGRARWCAGALGRRGAGEVGRCGAGKLGRWRLGRWSAEALEHGVREVGHPLAMVASSINGTCMANGALSKVVDRHVKQVIFREGLMKKMWADWRPCAGHLT